MKKKQEPKKRQRMPNKEARTGWYQEQARDEAFYSGELGLTSNELEAVRMEGIRCKGRDQKETRMIRRYWARETEWMDEGYYLAFYTASDPTESRIASLGPYETDQESIDIYNALIKHMGFRKELMIGVPDEDDLDWGTDNDDLDWGEEEDDLDWGEEEEEEVDPDDMDWGDEEELEWE